MVYTLSMFNTGQVTLPKKWRSQHNTTKFIAKETKNGLLIQPVEDINEITDPNHPLHDNNVEYYLEDEKGVHITFKKGVDPQFLLERLKTLRG